MASAIVWMCVVEVPVQSTKKSAMPDRAARSSTWSACARLSNAVRADSRAFSAADRGTLEGLAVEVVIGDVRGHGRRDLALHALAGAEAPPHPARGDGDRARLHE